VAAHRIGPPRERRGPEDAHINSFLGVGDRIFVLCHNGHRKRPSEIIEFERDFRELNRIALPCEGCHDIVRLEDGSLLYCQSPMGRIGIAGGPTVQIDAFFTRGLAVRPERIAVGSSWFGARTMRRQLPGFVTFLDRDFRIVARVPLPAAPTQLRWLDGNDLSLSRPRLATPRVLG
jgi:hypothetical protein